MNLNSKLSAMSRESVAKADPAIARIMQETRHQLETSGLHHQAISAGEKIDDFLLRDAANTEFSSRAARSQGPLLLTWYRGIW